MKKIAVNKSSVFDILKTTLIAVVISLILVLVFSLIVNFVNISENVITAINQIIKIVSIFCACFIGIKEKRQGALKGALCGLIYTLLSVLIFGIISRSITFNALNLVDIAFGIVAGAISGILAVNLKKR